MKYNEFIIGWILLFAVFFTDGCTRYVKVSGDIKIPSLTTTKIPLRVGLYMSPVFRNYTFYASPFGAGTVHISLGDGMSNGAERVLKEVFEEVVILDKMESEINNQGIKLIIIPEIIETHLENVGAFKSYKCMCQVVCKWNIINPDGKTIYVNTFIGEGNKGISTISGTKRFTECMTLAVQDQYYKFLTHILSIKKFDL